MKGPGFPGAPRQVTKAHLARQEARASPRPALGLPHPTAPGAHPRGAGVGVVIPKLRHHLLVQKLEEYGIRHAPTDRPALLAPIGRLA